MAENELKMYGMLFENRLHRVALDEGDLRAMDGRIFGLAEFIVDLQTRKFIKYRGDAESLTTSNPFYTILMRLPLKSFKELKAQEPVVYV